LLEVIRNAMDKPLFVIYYEQKTFKPSSKRSIGRIQQVDALFNTNNIRYSFKTHPPSYQNHT